MAKFDEDGDYIRSGRLAKAMKLAKPLARAGITQEEAQLLSRKLWLRLAESTGVRSPSTTTTELAISMLLTVPGSQSSWASTCRECGEDHEGESCR